MAQARDEAGNIWELDAQGNPVRLVTSANGGRIIPKEADPTDVLKVPQAQADLQGKRTSIADTAFDNTSTLRKEFLGLPSVAQYNVALGTFNSSLKTAANAQGDQSLITSYAKMLDPNSAVREGEFATTANTQNIINQIKARFAKELGNGGMLTAEGRDAIRSEMRNLVVNRFKPEYDRDRAQYSTMAERSGFDPYMVVGDPADAHFPKGLLAEAGAGSKLGELPPAYQQAYDAFIKGGNFTPEQYAAFRVGLDRAFFPDAADQTETYLQEGARIIENHGVPGGGGKIPGVDQPMGAVEGAMNSALQTPLGTFAADAVNANLGGLPARLSGNQDDLEALRAQNPKSAFLGQVTGGIGGAIGAGKVLKLGALLGKTPALASPIAADLAYGATYGATQDDNPWRGAGIGMLSAGVGSAAGQALGQAAPRLFNRGGVAAADNAVPTTQQLRELAGEQYRAVEAAGEVAGENATQELADQTQQILASQGRLTPKNNLIDVNNPVARANQLIQDFAGAPMTPTQAQSVRSVLGDGLKAMDNGVPDNTQRRLSGMLMDNFDEWSDPVLPGIATPRETASRYLQGEEIARAREIADANSQWFTQSGKENALRSSFRDLDRSVIRGKRNFNGPVEGAIENVSRGDMLGNASRALGKFAPTSAIAALPSLSLGGAVGAGVGGMTGTAAGLGLAGLGMAGRALATQRTARAAEVAELLARGGPEYQKALEKAVKTAKRRGGLFGAGVGASTGSAVSR